MEDSNRKNLIKALGDRWGVKSPTTVTKRLNALKIKIEKDTDSGFYQIKEESLGILDKLNLHLKNKGATISSFLQNCTDITTTESKKITPANDETLVAEPIESFNSNGSNRQMMDLVAIAQQRATGVLIAERALTARYLANPELLEDELQEKISFWEEKCVPAQINPEDFAKKLLDTYA